MKTDLYIKSLLTLAVALLAVIAFRSTAGTASIVHAAAPSKYEVLWSDPGDGDLFYPRNNGRKEEVEAFLQKQINAEAQGGWELVGEIPVARSSIMFLVFKKQ